MVMAEADSGEMSEDEIAMMVALHHGNKPSPDDPVCKALEARGLAQRSAVASWELTLEGTEYVAKLA
jgi:hypothetical protein